MTEGATPPPYHLPGLDPAWSRLVRVVDGVGVEHTWHVLDNGAAALHGTLLCVHGNPTWSYLWRRLLASAPPGWRVLAPDQLGMGYSDRSRPSRTLADRVSDLGLLTAALDVTGPVVTVAHDWGGPVSLGWAAAHRAQLRGVVLTNTALHQPAGPSSPAGPALVRLAHAPLVRDLVCVRTSSFVRAATAMSWPRPPRPVRDAFAAPYATAARRESVGAFVADIPVAPGRPSRQVLDQVAEDARSLDVPALLLWGARDPVFGESHLDDLRDRLPQAQLHRYELASHLVTEDAPAYAAAVGGWVSDLATGATPAPLGDAAAAGSRRSSPGERLEARAGDGAPAVADVGRTTVSWDLLGRRVDEVASGLAMTGVRPGQRVALLMPPSAELTAAVYAVWRAGAVVVVADKGLGVRGMGRALRGARVHHVVGTGPGLLAARAMRLRLPGTRIAAGALARTGRRALGAEHSLAGLARLGRGAAPPPRPSVDDECAVVFTSGATGPAKGVVYRHRQLLAQLELVRSTYSLRDDDRIVSAFAPFSLYGPALGIGSAVPDMDVTSPGTLTATALADAVSAIGATVVFASPAALRGVLSTAAQLSASRRAALAGVRLVVSAGAPVPVPLLRSLRELLPGADLHTPYGMTEVLPVTDISLRGIEAAGPGEGVCVGVPLRGVDVAVSPLSSAAAADLPLTTEPGRTGEVCVRAGHVKDTYDSLWATQRASSRDVGWHRTGDVGHLDGQQRLWIEGRLEHLVTTPLRVVTPVGIEQRVEALDGVRSAATVGVGPVGTQQVVVVVVPESGPTRRSRPVAPERLTAAVRAVAGVVVAAVLVAPALPVDIRHGSKIDRRRVADWADQTLAGHPGMRTPR